MKNLGYIAKKKSLRKIEERKQPWMQEKSLKFYLIIDRYVFTFYFKSVYFYFNIFICLY